MIWLLNIFLKLFGLACISWCFYMAIFISKAYKPTVFHLPSMIFIFGILIGLIFLSYQLSFLFRILKSILFLHPLKIEKQISFLASHLEQMTDDYYQYGKSFAREMRNRYPLKKFPKLWQLVFNQLETQIELKDIRMLIEYDSKRTKDNIGKQIGALGFLANIAPSVGLLGTVLGLIKLLANLSDLSSLGSNMALALVTTLYGIFMSVLIFNPLLSRLQATQSQLMKSYHQVFFWFDLIENRKPSFYCNPHFWSSLTYEEKKAS